MQMAEMGWEMMQFDWQEERWEELFSEGNRVRLLDIDSTLLVTQNWEEIDEADKEESQRSSAPLMQRPRR